MTPAQQLKSVFAYLESIAPERRLVETVKLYYAYFLTMSELQQAFAKFGDDFRMYESGEAYKAALPWFSEHGGNCFSNLDELCNSTRPFIWGLDTLWKEFPDLLQLLGTPFVTNPVDYSNGKELSGVPLFAVDWHEERGLVRCPGGVMITRSIQPVVIGEAASENVVLVLPDMTGEEFTGRFSIIPAMDGGCAFGGLYGPAQLCINYADAVGIDDVDTAMLVVGRIDGTPEEPKLVEFDRFEYFSVRHTLDNGVEVPLVNVP